MRRRWFFRILGLLLLAALVSAGLFLWRAQTGLDRAFQMASFGLWPDARTELTRYLWIHPQEPRARLAMAEAYLNDEEIAADDAVEAARWHLHQVPDKSRFAAMARTQEGRIELFVLNRPQRAEDLFRHANQINPDAIDPYFMIWKLYDLTGRSHLAEEYFWKVYEASPPAARGSRLREWYMSQFFPATANPTLDQLMNITSATAGNAARTEGDRFVRFRNSEPDRAVGYAALARWFQHEGDKQFARQIIDEGLQKAENPAGNPFFVATRITVLIELGEFDEVEALMEAWPEPREGYEYFTTLGSVEQEVRGNFEAATDAYSRALANWPGQVDWRTLNRKATCLARLKRDEELTELRKQIKLVESLTDDKLHLSIRQALGSIEEPEKLAVITDFYQRLGRPREAQGWEEYRAWLRTAREQSAAGAASPPGGSPSGSPGGGR